MCLRIGRHNLSELFVFFTESAVMSYSYNRIVVPVILPIPGGLHPGKQLLLRGRVAHNQELFAINLREAEDGGDILFHFNPRQEDSVVVRNTLSGGEWGGEERDQPNFPFGKGSNFLLRIEVTEDGYHTYVNGKPFINYGHRVDPARGRFLQLGVGAEYYNVQFQDKYGSPYMSEIPGKMQIGKAVRVRGAARGDGGFNINLSCDNANEAIAFHFNPRPSEETVVMNANFGGWGEEERDFEGDYPFGSDIYFDITIVCTEDKFHVYVNENHFSDFNHRCDLGDISHLHILGDLDVADVEFLEPVDDDFVKEIPSGLEKGDVLLFRGFMRPEAERFAINLHYGLTIDSDVALHFNPRIEEGEIVFNTRTEDSWAEEERIDIPSCIAERKPFEIKIVTKSKGFKVYVNGSKCKKFASRGDIENIQGVNVTSGAFMYQVKLERKLDKPVMEKIPGGLKPGTWMVIHGMPKKHCDRFHINLQCGDDEESDVAFHFNPRFGETNCTVRNTYVDGSWQDEEREEESFPFEKKDTFEIVIKVMEDKFMTFVNGDRYIDFNHRLPMDRICHLQMDGLAEFYEPEFL